MSAIIQSDDILARIKTGIAEEQARLDRLEEIYKRNDPCKQSRERARLGQEIQGRISILNNLYKEAEIALGIKERERPSRPTRPTRSKPGRPGRAGPTGGPGEKGGQCCDDCK
jgi:hypothetical protein